MTLNKQQAEELRKVAEPLVEWMHKNCHPHCEVKVTQTTVDLAEEIAGHVFSPPE